MGQIYIIPRFEKAMEGVPALRPRRGARDINPPRFSVLLLLEEGQFPCVGWDIMPEDIETAVVAPDLEVAMVGGKPLIEHLLHLHAAVAEMEGPGCFLPLITCVAFHP